ncbi:peptide deformylase [Mycetocola spongiae]|uniref:peptide deformylase n=1 Tax=Mycetocola spongiae TaxID=2859226 RepID=UPI001CF2CC2F|nr:peptide deformylase [Mycetocola spongiae]UCR89471.1 peptide deformylase [Mycetocola spongiae]
MAILPICIKGEPVLHTVAAPVTEFDDSLRTLVADMFETMDAAPGVGLAAPQVGVGLRLFVYSYDSEATGPWRGVAINPTLLITPTEPGEPDEDLESEGCLSFPGERFPLRRGERAVLSAVDLNNEPFTLDVSGWRARILQHEYDHLDGYLYLDRLGSGDWKTAERLTKKYRWGVPGLSWTPGVDDIDA